MEKLNLQKKIEELEKRIAELERRPICYPNHP